MNGVLGISKNSVDDSIIIQTDDNLNTKWIVSVDINNTYDLFISSISDENTTYCMSLNYKLVSCLYTLNYSTGVLISSKWHQHTQNNGIILTSSSLKAIKIIKLVEDKLIANFQTKTGKSKLIFCKYLLFYSIVSRSTLDAIKIYYTYQDSLPIWYGFARNISKEVMFLPYGRAIFRITLSSDSLEVSDEWGYFRYNLYYDNPFITSVLIVNPSNSTDWTVDPSCSIKYVGSALIYQGVNYASAVTLDKFDFSFNGEYCNPPFNYSGNKIYSLPDMITDESTFGGKNI